MKKTLRIITFLMLFLPSAIFSIAQNRSGGGQSGTNAPPSSNQPTSPRRQKQILDMQGPVYVTGRIMLDTGQPPAESIGVELICEAKTLQAIRTDIGGYFTFSMGGGIDSNMDFSAANDLAPAIGRSVGNMPRNFNGSLRGCEVQASVPGFVPVNYPLTDHPDSGRLETGTLRLKRILEVPGSYVSFTSLSVPKNARDEYEKAIKDLDKKRNESAQDHLEKAVSFYGAYAAAWNELGRLHANAKNTDKALNAFERAITADPQYLQPYLSLITMHLELRHWEEAVQIAEKTLILDPSLALTNYFLAVGNLNLEKLDEAEKNALEAETKAQEAMPQIHVLLAEIHLRKQDFTRAHEEMREYLALDPDGPYAERVKKGLEEFAPTVP